MNEASDTTEASDGEPDLDLAAYVSAEPATSAAHLVQFYESDDDLFRAVAKFLRIGLSAGSPAIVIATREHARGFQQRLERDGVDVDGARAAGQLVLMDADETLSRFMRDGQPEPGLFRSEVGDLVSGSAAGASGSRLHAYGEMVDVLWKRGERKAALHLEELWNDLQRRDSFTLLCAYAVGSFYKEPVALHGVCATHTHVFGEPGLDGTLADHGEATVTVPPPQYAQTLAQEIVHREEVESALRESLRELRQKEEELRQSEEQLRDFVENATLSLHRVGPDGTILWANRAELELLGYTTEEYVGRSIADFHADEIVIAEILARLRRGEALHDQPARLRAKDGSIKHVVIDSNACFRDGEFSHSRCFTRDVTEHRLAEDALSRHQDRADRLIKITGAIASAVTAAEVFEAVVDHVAKALGASTAGLWLVDNEGGRTAKLVRSIGYKDDARSGFDGLSLDVDPSIPAIDSIRRGEPLWIPSREALLRAYPHLRSSTTEGWSYRVSCLPLISNGRTLGSLGITIDEARETNPDERDFLLLVARYAGQAIERLLLLKGERRNREQADVAAARMGLLGHASRAFGELDLDLDSRLQGIVSELANALTSCINVALIKPDGFLHFQAVHHPDPEAQALLLELSARAPLRVGEGATGTIVATGESVIYPAIDPALTVQRAPEAYRGLLERYPAYAMIGAPLRTRGRVIGTVTATRVHRGETYTQEDLALLEELAERAAPAIENSRLHDENAEARSRAEQLYHFAKSVVSAEKVEEVFTAALDAISGALGADRSAILTYDDAQVMRFRSWRRLSEKYRSAVEGHAPWRPDAVAPQPVLVADVARDADLKSFLPLFQREEIGAMAFIPLVTRGKLIGKFMVYYGERHEFTPSEIDLAGAIANHLASVTARFAAITKLEDTLRYNELFAGVLGHDLRNPLGAMMTAAHLVLRRQEGEGDRNAKPLSRILASGERMMRMIDQLLDLTRARSGGGIPVDRAAADLGDLCGQAIGELELSYPNWKIERRAVGHLGGNWDVDRLLQIVSNLVCNAGQHGPVDGNIVVSLDGRRADSVTMLVHNEGAIPETVLPTLFDPFRGTRHRREYSRGLGLGLFIVKEIVRAHGGTVDVASSEKEGTTFTLSLPRRGDG
jgi:PAS domain S-box-containing protein